MTTEEGLQQAAGELTAYLSERREKINTALKEILENTMLPGRLRDAMAYSLEAGGKRLRPILCMAAAEAVGGDPDMTLPAGCAIEFIHTYSLIHDDLPAVDNDDLRRGQPSCHLAFDEATAIFAGDALQSLAFFILSNPENRSPDARNQLAVINAIAAATGHDGMIEGQMRDMLAQKTPADETGLKRLHGLKTGAIIRAAVRAGALIGNGTDRQLASLDTYAENIGLAFQVMDDILDVQGDPDLMGKAAGGDRRRRKATYPGLLGIDEARQLARTLVENALQTLEPFDVEADPLRSLARYIVEREY